MTDLSKDIETFFSHFKTLRQGILDTQFKFAEVTCKSILLCSILDTLSKCVYNNVTFNRDRFVYFVDDFSGWPYRDKISLIQLRDFVDRETDIKYERTKSFLRERFKNLRPGDVYKASNDLVLADIPHLKIIEDEVRQFTYSSLLYKYRNSVVHEFKTPGSGVDFGHLNELYYHHMRHFEVADDTNLLQKTTWELVFPIIYLSDLVLQSITNTQAYCQEHSINPYNFFFFDSSWLTSQEVKKKRRP